MKRAIEFEQTINLKHRIVVECDNENTLDYIAELTGDSFYDIYSNVPSGVNILEISPNYSDDDSGVFYYDDYWTQEEVEAYGE